MTTNKDPYTPVACGLHSEYELAIMHKASLRLTWLDADNMQHTDTLAPEDLITRNQEEYLRARNSQGQVYEIRLDKIIQHTPV